MNRPSAPQPSALSIQHYLGLAAIALLCLATRAGHVAFECIQRDRAGLAHSPFESEIIALNLVTGRGYSFSYFGKRMPTANAPPCLVFALAGLYALWTPAKANLVFQCLQAAMAAASLVLTWALARRAFDMATAWLAALLFILDVNLSYTSVWIQETALNLFFTLLGLWGLVRLADTPTMSRAAVSGMAFGGGILCRPTVVSMMAAGLAWLVWASRRGGASASQQVGGSARRTSRKAETVPSSSRPSRSLALSSQVAVVLGCCAAVLAPWTLRNALVFGRFIPVSQNFGLSLWYGNNPKATGSQVDAQGRRLQAEGALLAQLKAATSEAEIDRAYRRAALEFIREHPAKALWLRVKCFAYYWLDHNYWLRQPFTPVPWWLKWGNVVLIGLTAGAILWYLIASSSRQATGSRLRATGYGLPLRPVSILLLLSIAASCLTYTLIHADVGNRYRMQIEPLMLVFVAAFARSIWQQWRVASVTHPTS